MFVTFLLASNSVFFPVSVTTYPMPDHTEPGANHRQHQAPRMQYAMDEYIKRANSLTMRQSETTVHLDNESLNSGGNPREHGEKYGCFLGVQVDSKFISSLAE